MVKTKIVETTEKYDENGKLVEKITREETSEDDTVYYPSYQSPVTPLPYINPDTGKKWESYCSIITTQDGIDIKLV